MPTPVDHGSQTPALKIDVELDFPDLSELDPDRLRQVFATQLVAP